MGGLCSTGVRPLDKKAESEAEAPTSSKQSKMKMNYNPYPADYDPPFPTSIVGTFSNHGIEPDFENNAIVKANQDRGSVDFPFAGNNRQVLFCCLDGHGRDGDKVSQFTMESIHDIMEVDVSKLALNPKQALVDAFEETDNKLRRSEVNSHSSGTSVVSVYMLDNKLWIANAGDSRAVMGKMKGGKVVAEDLTWDQKPDSKGEIDRIQEMGGVVTPPEDVGLSARVWTRNGRYGLSMARSIGDHLLAKNGVICTPEVEEREITEDDEFIILATDGIWEFIESQKAVDIVAKHDNATEACYELIHNATKLWRQEEGDYRDDITAIVIFVKKQQQHMKKMATGINDCVSPTSKDLRKKRNLFPGGLDSPTEKEEEAKSELLPASVNSEKAKTFRKRRLSLNPMDEDVIKDARKQHDAEASGDVSGTIEEEEGDPVPPKKERKRRLSISPDMDASGQKLVPEGM